MKAKQAQKLENLAKGHGHYSEIVEDMRWGWENTGRYEEGMAILCDYNTIINSEKRSTRGRVDRDRQGGRAVA